MLYTTPQDVRDLLGLSVEDADDTILEEFITKAQQVILHYVTIYVDEEEVKLDSSGQTIRLENQYIADVNFDKIIDANDVVVYGYPTDGDVEGRTRLTISAIWPEEGVIKLAQPATNYAKVTASYSYYTCAIDWNLISLATAYYAGMLWVAREEFLVPEQLTIGNVRVRQSQPWDYLRNEFLRIIFHLTSIPMDIVNYRKIMVPSRSKGKYYGPQSILSDVEDTSQDEYTPDPEAQ